MKKVVITSGYYNPMHIGHLNLFKESKKIGDILVVIVNNDLQVKLKGSVPFMKELERVELIKAIKYVDDVLLSIDKDSTIIKSLRQIAEKYKGCRLFFAKGGDSTKENVPELDACKELDIEVVFGVGGGKIQSSSWLIKKAKDIF